MTPTGASRLTRGSSATFESWSRVSKELADNGVPPGRPIHQLCYQTPVSGCRKVRDGGRSRRR